MFSVAPDVVVLAAGLSFVVAYLIINQVWLRIVVLIGTGFYIWYYAIVDEAPLWTAIWTSVAMGAANIIGLCLLLYGKSRMSLPKAFQDVYESEDEFRTLSPGNFGLLMRDAKRKVLDQPLTITTEAKPIDHLYFVLKGGAKVEKLGKFFDLPHGVFIGEAAFLLDQPSAATITLDPGSEILKWRFADLKRRSVRNSQFRLVLDAVVSRDLARKVALAVAAET